MQKAYVQGYDPQEHVRLEDQARTLVDSELKKHLMEIQSSFDGIASHCGEWVWT